MNPQYLKHGVARSANGHRVAVVAESSATAVQLESFGRALTAALEAKGLTSGALLSLTTASSPESRRRVVTKWMRGEVEPSRPKVLALEVTLGLDPGTLSRHLGWVPVDAQGLPTVEASILADGELTPTQKNILLAALQDFRRG